MPQLAPIVINDGAATPVAHTYTPIGKPSGSAWDFYVERVGGKPEFQREVRVKSVQPTRKGAAYRVDVTMLVPITKIVDSVEVLDYQNRVDVSFTLASTGATQSRKDLRVCLKNLFDNSQVIAFIDNLENSY